MQTKPAIDLSECDVHAGPFGLRLQHTPPWPEIPKVGAATPEVIRYLQYVSDRLRDVEKRTWELENPLWKRVWMRFQAWCRGLKRERG